MLNLYPTVVPGQEPDQPPRKPLWIDLLRPTPEEEALVAAEHGIRLPSHAQLAEIETSSRLRVQGRTLTLSMPLGIQDHRDATEVLPLGFVLTPDILVTIRYCDIHAFPDARAELPADAPTSSAAVFVTLLENMVDFGADRLEQISGGLGGISHRIFGSPGHPAGARRRLTRVLHQHLITIGQTGEQLSRIRESLLGLARIAAFTSETACDWFSPDLQTRLKTVRHDLTSLTDFESHLSGKTQFLLDATLGFINTEQNDIFKVLTIVSVVGIPPTLLASIYGMNFHNIPEYEWRYGYQYGLGVILLSTLLPMLWFKWRKWW